MVGRAKSPGSRRLTAVVGLGLMACTAMQLEERFSPLQGQVAPVRGADDEATEDDVALYFEQAPEGLVLVGGQPQVQVGYEHVILGKIELDPDDGHCDPPAADILNRSQLFARLRDRAYREGGDAVVFITTRAAGADVDDCTQLRRQRWEPRQGEPWARGFVVRLAPDRPLEGLSELPVADAGSPGGRPGADAGLPSLSAQDLPPAPPQELPPAPPRELPPAPPRELPPAPPPRARP